MFSKLNRRVCAWLLSFVFVFCCTAFSVAPVNAETNENSSNLVLSYSAGNGWNDGKANYQQVNCTLENKASGDITDWKISFQLPVDTTINQSWCGEYSMDASGKLVVTPSSSNGTIFKGGSSTLGFILKSDSNIVVKDAKVESYTLNGIVITGDEEVETTPTPSPSKEVETPTPSPSKEVVSPSPSPSEEVETPTPTPTKEVETPSPSPSQIAPSPSFDVTGHDWLHTDGSKIYDENGKEVWLTGLNWFGYNTGTNCFDGIWACDLDKALQAIADRGFNLIRVPMSSELLLQWKNGEYPKPCLNAWINKNLTGLNSLEVFDHVIDECDRLGVKIMIDIHSVETNAAGHFAPLWYTENISEEQYIESLDWVSERYKNNDTIIAYDLQNEPHGKANDTEKAIWNDSDAPNNWKRAAEVAAKVVLGNNPHALIMVEGVEIYPKDLETNSDYHVTDAKQYHGTWWGANLRGVKDYPIDLGKYQNQLVYSPHDYGPSVFMQDWFQKDYTIDTLKEDVWEDNWLYIQEQNIAPLLIGEWGGFMQEPNLKWMTLLRQLIVENKINHTFWCYNANSGDTGGLVGYDYSTWDEAKYDFVKEALWQENGKFVGLSQDTKLGANGTCVGELN